MATSVGFSLFPSSTKETHEGQAGPYNVPALTSRQSMLDFKRSSRLAKRVNSENSDMQSADTSPTSSRQIGARRDSLSAKSQNSSNAPSTQLERSRESPQRSHTPENPYSPNSFFAQSERSTSPTLIASSRNSMSTLKTRKKAPPASIDTQGSSSQIRSIFPTFDPNLPLDQQYYLPTQTSPRNIPWEQVCKAPYSPDFEITEKKAEAETSVPQALLFTAPQNTQSMFTPDIELPSLWELSQGRANSEARSQTYRLQMHRCEPLPKKSKQSKGKPSPLHPLLSFGPSSNHPFFSVFSEPCTSENEKSKGKEAERIRIRKHNLGRFDSSRDHYGESSILVSDMNMQLGDAESVAKADEDFDPSGAAGITKITPHKAILDSLSMAGTSSEAEELATTDPGARSIAAAHLAEVAMIKAKRKHTSSLKFSVVPALRQRGYALQHPSLGYFQIQIEGDVRLSRGSATDSKSVSEEDTGPVQKPGSIKLFAPVSEKVPPTYGFSTSSHNAFKNPATVLASIDLPSSTLTLDGAALTSLNDRYMVDTAVSALVTVLLAETACPRISHLTSFAPPPTLAMYKASLKSTPKYKYLPMIKSKKEPKASKADKATGEMEQSMTMALGALVFVLEAAVDGLHTMAERAKTNNTA